MLQSPRHVLDIKVVDIPCDWLGIMGVPVTFLDKYNSKQFEIIGFRKGNDGKDLRYTQGARKVYPYMMILIRRIGDIM